MKKSVSIIRKILITFAGVALFVTIPFVIEAILFDETHFPFSMKIMFGRDVWFSFIGSYLGAIGTILLGLVAFLQNKQYKKLSDEKDEEVKGLQIQIKDLIQSNNDLTEGNKNIQENIREIIEKNTMYVESTNALQQEIKKLALSDANLQKNIIALLNVNKDISEALLSFQKEIYHPRVHILRESIISDNGEDINEFGDDEEIAYVLISSEAPLGCNKKEYIKDHCGFIAFSFVNDGDKDITTFVCEKIQLPKSYKLCQIQRDSIDVKPHQKIRCVIAVEKSDFDDFVSKLVDTSTEIMFSLYNSIGEGYILSSYFIVLEIEGTMAGYINELSMEQVESVDAWNREYLSKYS